MSCKREFKFNDNGKCDRCHSLGDIFHINLSLTEELENKLLHTFIHYEECGHNVCHQCIEKASDKHSKNLDDIECPKCESEKFFDKRQQEKINTYCHCPKEVEKLINQEKEKNKREEELYNNMTEEEKWNVSYYKTQNFLRILSGTPRFPDYSPSLPTCKDCNKEQMYYIGIDDDMKRLCNLP